MGADIDICWPKLIVGGFMVLHDYGALGWAGVTKAVDEKIENGWDIHGPFGSLAYVRKNGENKYSDKC